MKEIVIMSDAHLEHTEPAHASYKLVKKYIKATKPEKVILNGDMLDMSYISSYNKDMPALLENKRLYKDMKMMRDELDFFEKYSKEVLYLAGNHEYRLNILSMKNPNFMNGILSYEKLLNIDYYVEEADQPIEILPDLYAMHGKRYGTHVAAATVKDYMENIIFGHTHRIQTYSIRTMQGSVTGWNQGCLCDKSPKYLNGRMNQWNNGFIIIEYDNNGWSISNKMISNNSFIHNGHRWRHI